MEGSEIVVEGPRCSLRTRKVYTILFSSVSTVILHHFELAIDEHRMYSLIFTLINSLHFPSPAPTQTAHLPAFFNKS